MEIEEDRAAATERFDVTVERRRIEGAGAAVSLIRMPQSAIRNDRAHSAASRSAHHQMPSAAASSAAAPA
jgi:hypothetical protein